MSESNSEKVQRFIEYNQCMISTAMIDENQKDQSIHAKVLLCCIFDSLAKSRFPNGMSNGERFKKTVVEYSCWSDHERVSLLHLIRALKKAGIPTKFEPLYEWVNAEFSNKFSFKKSLSGNERPVSMDPLLRVVQNNWPTDENGNFRHLGNIQIEHLLHKHLLWLYRNRLVHEYRIPGLGSESPFRLEYDPYYQQVSTIDFSRDTGIRLTDSHWELVYPTGFFRQITETVLMNIAKFHKQNETSPFTAYSDGNYWIPEFNEE